MKPTSIGAATLTTVLNSRMRPINRSGLASSVSASSRAAIAGLGSMPQPVAIQAHQRGLAAGEKGGQKQQDAQRSEQTHR